MKSGRSIFKELFVGYAVFVILFVIQAILSLVVAFGVITGFDSSYTDSGVTASETAVSETSATSETSAENSSFITVGVSAVGYEGTASGRESYNITGIFLLCIFVFFIADSTCLGIYSTRRIKKPIGQIMDGMERVKCGEKYTRLNFKSQKEFVQIQQYFNDMMDELETAESEKEELMRQQNRMLLELSHDIKTPVATIKSYANVLKDGVAAEEKKTEYYELIDRKADRVSELVNQMFLMLKYDNADYKLELKKTDICELIRQISGNLYDEMTKNGRGFEPGIPEKPIYVLLDEKEFTRVIENLLYNAAKYNITGSRTSISVQETNGSVEVRVRDDGEAISEDMRDKLFEAFSRGDESRSSAGGTGLGLTIAKKIMEKHGGDILYIYVDGFNEFKVSLKLFYV